MIIYKNKSFLMKIINILLIIVTFGRQKSFMTNYTTTIGTRIYVPNSWDEWSQIKKDVILFHENVHVNQFKKEGWLFFFKYLFFPMPFFHAHARLEYEIEAYAKDIVFSYRKYGTPVIADRFDNVILKLSGPDYVWTCTNKTYIAKRLLSNIFKELKETRNENSSS